MTGPTQALSDYTSDTRILARCARGFDWNYIASGESFSTAAGFDIVTVALPAGDSYSGITSIVTAAAASNAYGIGGYVESDLTGTVAGTVYGFGSWINFDVDAKCGSYMFCAQDNGIYAPGAMGADISSAKLVIGMRMECVIDDGQNPGSLFLFSTNIFSNAVTALIDCNAAVDLGFATGAATTNVGKIPLFRDASGSKTWYVNVYDG